MYYWLKSPVFVLRVSHYLFICSELLRGMAMYEDRLNNDSLPALSMPLHQHRLEPLNLAGGERVMQEVSREELLGGCSCFALPSNFPISILLHISIDKDRIA